MSFPEPNTLWLHDRVDRLRAGDRQAADELLQATAHRIEQLARCMLRNYPRVRAGADTSDVVSGAMMRLVNALREVRPESAREFAGLAALQIRRELLDLARHFAARGVAQQIEDPDMADFGISEGDSPADLELWSRFHGMAETLPTEEREVFGLLFYQGYSRPQAALLLGVSERTVYRWWASACLLLNERLGGELPPV